VTWERAGGRGRGGARRGGWLQHAAGLCHQPAVAAAAGAREAGVEVTYGVAPRVASWEGDAGVKEASWTY
jgi:hypothetical protein